MVRRIQVELILILLLTVTALVIPAVAASPLPSNRHIFISPANGVKYDMDGAAYGGPSNTYYIKADGGGLNELHLSTDPSSPYGQITSTTSQSGTFYVTNTGGRGFDNDIVLLISVRGPIPDDFGVTIRSSGYSWTPAPAGYYQPTLNLSEVQYVSGGVDGTFGKSDFSYGPQTWKPGPGTLGTPSLPLYYGQDINDDATGEYLLFVDLKVGNIEGAGGNATSQSGSLTDKGAARVEFSFTGLTTHASFNAYGWTSAAFQGQGISWTNKLADPGASGYTVVHAATPTPTSAVPTASFSANVTNGVAPLAVRFTDASTGNGISAWSWTFGDGGTSDEQSPVHMYTAVGTYNVNLTVTNAGGSDSEVKVGYVTVTVAGPTIARVPGGTDVPIDTNGDGVYEDVNGNGRRDFADVVLYFNQMNWIAGNEPVAAFDYNANGRIDFADVVWLFNHL